MDTIKQLKRLIECSHKIVFFEGAGVSTESGIQDFRSQDGLYRMQYQYPPEQILSHSFFMKNTKAFYQFYKEKMNCTNASPNIYHIYLKELEMQGKLGAIITQNIDGLHDKVKNQKVLELHGSIYRNHCLKCGKGYTAEIVFSSREEIPKCDCGGIIKPDVVLYEEMLDEEVIEQAIQKIVEADLLIVVGTSLKVYPAKSFIQYYRGKELVMINLESTDCDSLATLMIHEKIGDVLKQLKK